MPPAPANSNALWGGLLQAELAGHLEPAATWIRSSLPGAGSACCLLNADCCQLGNEALHRHTAFEIAYSMFVNLIFQSYRLNSDCMLYSTYILSACTGAPDEHRKHVNSTPSKLAQTLAALLLLAAVHFLVQPLRSAARSCSATPGTNVSGYCLSGTWMQVLPDCVAV